MNEMSSPRSVMGGAGRVLVLLVSVSLGAALGVACGKAASPSNSSSSHWLVCEMDADCASLGPSPQCGAEGYCVDAAGERISLLVESTPGAGDAGDGRDASTGRRPPDDAGGACVGLGCSRCVPPRLDSRSSCEPMTVWHSDPGSGACCEYASNCEVPEQGPVFASAEECQDSCRCAEVDAFGVERISIECLCQGDCLTNMDDFMASITCNDMSGVPLFRSRGCGMIEIVANSLFIGSSSVFDEASGSLIGRSYDVDTPEPPCGTTETIAGREFVCNDVERCQLCGPQIDEVPPCD